ncbi:hypothetical protein BSZ14_05580 [Sphingomonas sp. Sph1(2015)]|jgi:hypothetical protein|nr:hypothetical protein BSZ14_05580 [Sphingomonas sp. Sph1(2015)]
MPYETGELYRLRSPTRSPCRRILQHDAVRQITRQPRPGQGRVEQYAEQVNTRYSPVFAPCGQRQPPVTLE